MKITVIELIPSPSKETSWKRNLCGDLSPDNKYILQTFEIKPESATMEAEETNKNNLSVCIAKID